MSSTRNFKADFTFKKKGWNTYGKYCVWTIQIDDKWTCQGAEDLHCFPVKEKIETIYKFKVDVKYDQKSEEDI